MLFRIRKYGPYGNWEMLLLSDSSLLTSNELLDCLAHIAEIEPSEWALAVDFFIDFVVANVFQTAAAYSYDGPGTPLLLVEIDMGKGF